MRVLLTGRPGIGKTTVVRRFIDQYDRPTTGFYTKAIEHEGRRYGFQICTLAGERGLLAHTDLENGPRVGRYRVNIAEFERIVLPALSAPRESTLLVLDEIGKMECLSPCFRQHVKRLFEQANPLLATIPRYAIPFTTRLKQRPDVELVHVTEANRDALPALLLQQLMHDIREGAS